ncbi:MAG: polysaccharide deacetylase family protein [Elusimicrobia bacterium]|nr:polysaccharide deacetylase family protein [Elusimicrobiota bacterium]
MTVVPVLTYHHVAPDQQVTPKAFEDHLRWLKERGYRTLRLSDLEQHVSGAKPAPARSLMLTFDDAYADTWVYAHPLLKKYGMTAVLFIPTAFPSITPVQRLTGADGGSIADTHTMERGFDGFLSWGEIKAMGASGVWEFGSHTHTHRCFNPETAYAPFEDELIVSRKTIESKTGQPCFAFAWPWGQVVDEWTGRLAKCGYRLAFANPSVRAEPGTDPLRLSRYRGCQARISWLKGVMEPGQDAVVTRAPAKPRRTQRRAARPTLRISKN